jgi:hypothetical protein
MYMGLVILVEYPLSGVCAQEDGLVPRLDIDGAVGAVKQPSGYGICVVNGDGLATGRRAI